MTEPTSLDASKLPLKENLHERTKRQERRTVNLRLAPPDFRVLAAWCDEQGRSYGELVSLLINERLLRSQTTGVSAS